MTGRSHRSWGYFGILRAQQDSVTSNGLQPPLLPTARHAWLLLAMPRVGLAPALFLDCCLDLLD